eukprot:1745763-Pleurochrysis_carterae.AAC.1
MAEAAAGMSVLVATDSAAVAGVDEAIPVACIMEAGRTAVDVAVGTEDHSRCLRHFPFDFSKNGHRFIIISAYCGCVQQLRQFSHQLALWTSQVAL